MKNIKDDKKRSLKHVFIIHRFKLIKGLKIPVCGGVGLKAIWGPWPAKKKGELNKYKIGQKNKINNIL
jgi:hypothetical protein